MVAFNRRKFGCSLQILGLFFTKRGDTKLAFSKDVENRRASTKRGSLENRYKKKTVESDAETMVAKLVVLKGV